MKNRFVLEIGMGTSLRSEDYTKAGVRAVKDALWKNSLNISQALGKKKDDMIIDVTIGVQNPAEINTEAIKSVFPYGKVSVEPKIGGLDVAETETTAKTIIAVAAIIVSFNL